MEFSFPIQKYLSHKSIKTNGPKKYLTADDFFYNSVTYVHFPSPNSTQDAIEYDRRDSGLKPGVTPFDPAPPWKAELIKINSLYVFIADDFSQ